MMSSTLRTAIGSALCLAAAAAVAQAPATPSSGQAPNTVGVTPQAAAEATQKAVPRSDTGTLVRTAPTATDRARAAADTTSASGTATPTTGEATRAPMSDGTTRTAPVRRARADRN